MSDSTREYIIWLLIIAGVGFFGGHMAAQQVKDHLVSADPASQLYYYDPVAASEKNTTASIADNDQAKAIYVNHVTTVGLANQGCGCPACCGAI